MRRLGSHPQLGKMAMRKICDEEGQPPPVSPPTPLSYLSDTEPENTKTEPVKDTRKKGTARERRERLKRQAARAGTDGKLRSQQRKRRKLNAGVRILGGVCRFPVAAEYRELPKVPSHLAPVKD